MKKFSSLFLNSLFLGLLLVGAASCKKSDKDSVKPATDIISFTMNGDGLSNQSFVVNSSTPDKKGTGTYKPTNSTPITSLVMGGKASSTRSVGIGVTFVGKATGTLALDNDEAAVVVALKEGNTERFYQNTDAAGSLVISKYENVGGKIEGTFSGTFIRLDANQDPVLDDNGDYIIITISNGKFSVDRLADAQ